MASVPDPPRNEPTLTNPPDNPGPPWLHLPDETLRDMSTERGHSDVERPPRPIQEEFACTDHPPCTDLLWDLAGVLNDETRWPDHLCRGLFFERSTTEWAFAHLGGLSSLDLESTNWLSKWPLPIGRAAIAKRLPHPSKAVKDLAPFKGHEEALWAIQRSDDSGNTMDLFGLSIPYRSGEQTTYKMGELKYVVRGSDTRQFDLVRQAERWWTQFRDEQWRGRPTGSRRTWESKTEFWIALWTAVRAVREQGGKVTQEKVAARIGCDDRVLRRWLKEHSIPWEHVLRIP